VVDALPGADSSDSLMISLVTHRPGAGVVPDRVPQAGDVVVRSAAPDATPQYVMSAVPGPDQCGCATRAEAVRMARSFARRCGVSLWFAENPRDFTLLESFRPPSRQLRPGDGTPGAAHGRQMASPGSGV
jgi:hypothetical protein